ncbi:hypothetical protein, partial [Yersinia enterocolitica]
LRESLLTLSMVSMHSIQGNLRKNGEFINNQGGAVLHHNSPIPWSIFAQYLTAKAARRRKPESTGRRHLEKIVSQPAR